MDEKRTGLTIKQVAERTGVSAHTLRAWERRYGVPAPAREAGNKYRRYDERDIGDVLFMKQHVEKGVPPAQASALLRQQKRQAAGTAPTESSAPSAAMQQSLLDAFVRSDETAARQVIDQAFALFAPEVVARQVIEPTLHEVGERWLRGEMSVWQEHLASSIIQHKLFAVLQSQPQAPFMSPHLVAVSAPSEEHQLGLAVFTLLARRQGWRVTYLGQGTPLDDLRDIARGKPDIIAISITTVLGLAGLIPWLDAANRPAVPLVFGGRMPNMLPSLRAHLPGAFLGEDTVAAVQQLSSVRACADYWAPARRVRELANALQQRRLEIAGDTAADFMAALPADVPRKWDLGDLDAATLFMIDTLSCALAFDVPELVDLQRQWLQKAMPPRAVSASLIVEHLRIFEGVLGRLLPGEPVRILEPLVERMVNDDWFR